MTSKAVLEIVEDYLKIFPNETEKLAMLRERLLHEEVFNHRKSFNGHGTGAAIVLSPDKKKILLIHHRGLDKWMQPGGHWDPEDPNPWMVALREAEEETGVGIAQALHIDPDQPHIPLDIDSHHIPANEAKDEPEHYHHDFRYAFVASSEAVTAQEREIVNIAWVPVDAEDSRLIEVWSPLAKLRERKIIG